jgi:hypothetical protein
MFLAALVVDGPPVYSSPSYATLCRSAQFASRRRARMFGVTVALSLLLSGAASEPPVGALFSAFGPGEQATYRVAYLGVTAGTARITVGGEMKQWGQEVWPIVAMAQTESLFALFPVKDKFISYWDAQRRRTIGSDLFADENRKRRKQRIELQHEQGRAVVHRQKEGEAPVIETQDVPAGAFDIAAAAYSIRNHSLEVGKTYELPIFTGKKSFALRATVEGKQNVQTAMGAKDCFKVRVQTDFSGKFQAKRDTVLYISAEEGHVVVRLEAEFVLGTLVAELTDYKQGRTSTAAAAALNGNGG